MVSAAVQRTQGGEDDHVAVGLVACRPPLNPFSLFLLSFSLSLSLSALLLLLLRCAAVAFTAVRT